MAAEMPSPGVSLPGSFAADPSPDPRWDDPSCVPLLKIAGFEQRVLYKHGPAQVGFSFSFALLSSFTVSSRW